MNAEQIKNRAKKDFNNAIAVMSIIPVLGLVYLIVGKIASLSILEGDVGYAMLILLVLMLLGIISGKKILWYMITKIIDMQNEIVEKGRLAAISETFISLSHEIRNPLAMIMGNMDLLMGEASKGKIQNLPGERVRLIQADCGKIAVVMDKMSRISKPSFTTIGGNIKMLDLPACELDNCPKK